MNGNDLFGLLLYLPACPPGCLPARLCLKRL
jgi:hypothetical protein